MRRAQVNHDPSRQQGHDIQHEPPYARPFHDHAMKRAAFQKEEVDGIARGTGTNIETQEHAKGAIHGEVACNHLALMEPKAICARDDDQRQQKSCLSAVLCLIDRQLFDFLGSDEI
jgi:hypothetical protein